MMRTLSALIFICFAEVSFCQQTDYKEIFGDNWIKAEKFLNENKSWMIQLSKRYDISYPLAVAVIFPELIRYSAIRDKIEVTLLKTLYVNLGEDYADFSIGQFQMKPSFAEEVHKKISLLKGNLRNQFRGKENQGNWKEYRSAIVKDLEDPESQFLYLFAFFKICEASFDLKNIDDLQKVKFLATAYNYSFTKTYDQICGMIEKKFFSTKIGSTENYPYADISVYWYETRNKRN